MPNTTSHPHSERKIPLIALLDDNEGTNFIHRKYLEKSGQVEAIRVYTRPIDLLKALDTDSVRPSVICIDMNMDQMNAFEFLARLSRQQWVPGMPEPLIYLLSVSLTPQQERVAERHPMLKGVLEKPLQPERIQAIHRDYCLSELVDSL